MNWFKQRFSHYSFTALSVRIAVFIMFCGCFLLVESSLLSQDISIPIRSRFSLEEGALINFGPDIGWSAEARRTPAPPQPPPGAFDVRVIDDFLPLFEDIRVFEDSVWYQWEVRLSPLSLPTGQVDTTFVFFDRCELLNNARQAFIVNRDSSVVIDMVRDSIAIIDSKFRVGTSRTFKVWILSKNTISDDPPLILAQLPDATLDPNEPRPYLINVSSFFASVTGAPLRFSAQTNTDLVNLRTTEIGIVELILKEGVQDTSLEVIVTAFGGGCGFVEQRFTVTIPAIINLPIALIQELPDFALQGNFPTRVLVGNLNEYFVDGNGTQPQFAISFNATVVSIVLSGNAVLASSVNGVFNRESVVTIIATDGEFSTTDSFILKIGEPNRVPQKTNDIPTIEVEPNFGILEALYFRNYFQDPDNDRLFYNLTYDQTKITAFVQGDTLFLASIAGVKNARIGVNLNISDGLLAIQDEFIIRIKDNLAPQIATSFADTLQLVPGFSEYTWINLNELFIDPEDNQLTYSLDVEQDGVANFSIVNNSLMISEIDGVQDQDVQVTVIATDGINMVSKTFNCIIIQSNVAPVVSTNTIEIVQNYANDLVIYIQLKDYFSDPNSDSLTYSITVSSNVLVILSNDSTTIETSGEELQIHLDADSSILRITPLFNSRLDQDIFVEASDGEFTVGLVIELNLFPQGISLPTQGNLKAGKNLYRSFPNPAQVASSIKIIYEIPEGTNLESELAEVNVYNILGRLVKQLVRKRQDSGVYTVNFDTRGLASGTYIYTLRTSKGLVSRKLTLID
jgi:hypothetical protein